MIPMFKQMIEVYWDTLCFKRSPIDTPDSSVMLGLAVILSLLMSLGQLSLSYHLGKVSMPFWASMSMVVLQLILAFAYLRFILWTQNKISSWQKMMTCWVMMLFLLDGFAFLFMFMIWILHALGIIVSLQKLIISLSIVVGIVLSFWQISFSIRLYRIFLQQTIWFAVGVYLGWFGLNFLLLSFFRTLLKV